MCPRCKEPLIVFELEGIEIDHCPECRGTWLEVGEFELIAERAGAEPGPISDALLKGRGEKAGKLHCPRCPAPLRVMHIEGVELDRCPHDHGIWFDAGEMKTLIESFNAGETGALAAFFGDILRDENPSGKGD